MQVTKNFESFYEIISSEPWYMQLVYNLFRVDYERKYMHVKEIEVEKALTVGREYMCNNNVVWICAASIDGHSYTIISDPIEFDTIKVTTLNVYDRDRSAISS
jgi:hypothetical protein